MVRMTNMADDGAQSDDEGGGRGGPILAASQCIAVVSQWCYGDVTVVSVVSEEVEEEDPFSGVTVSYSGVSVVLQWCYSGVTVVLWW
jgi:hypothetical protein